MTVLDTYTPIAGYFATDRTAMPLNSLADGSYNVFILGANNQHVFRGLKPAGIGGRSMFVVIEGYAALVDSVPDSESESESEQAAASVLVSGAGTSAANGVYTLRGVTTKPYYNLTGFPDNALENALVWDGSQWLILSSNGGSYYYSDDDVDFPYDVTTWIVGEEFGGLPPAPSVEAFIENATEGFGSVFNYIARSLFWIGEGDLYYNGAALVDSTTSDPFIATSNLQLSPYPYEHAYTAGLAQPDAPQVEALSPTDDTAFSGLLTGLYSFKIARVRSVTGGRSIASVTSAVISFSGQTARLTFPAADSNGQDRWAVFGTKAGFGGTGAHYLIQEVAEADLETIDGVPRSIQIEYADSDLLPVTAFVDDYPPPAGSFGGRLENYVVVVGAYDNAVAISIRNFPESFAPEDLGFLPKAPTAVLQDQMGSYLYASTESTVHAISVAPTAFGNPLIIQTVWTDVGFAHQHNACVIDGVLFGFVSRQGAVTMDSFGRPSNEFARPVAKKMALWEAENVGVFSVPDLNMVIYTHEGEAFGFSTQNLQWSSPAQLNDFAVGNAVSGVVIDRRLKICLFDGVDFDLYDFDEQPEAESEESGTNFKIVSPDRKLNPAARFNITGVKATFQAPEAGDYAIKLVTDYDGQNKTLVHSATGEGMQETVVSRWALFRKNAARVEFTGTQSDFTQDCYLAAIITYGENEDSNRLT